MAASTRIVIAGGSGFLGRSLCHSFLRAGYDVVVLSRNTAGQAAQSAAQPERASVSNAPAVRRVQWTPDGKVGPWVQELDAARAVVNLAGESIGKGRWTDARKQQLRTSRMAATGSLVAGIRACRTPPAVFISASAIGYYGSRGDEVLTEESAAGNDFLALLCQEWERAAAAALGTTRVVLTRTGLVLDAKEGALPRMLTPIKLFVGGPIASGHQYISWIHLDDWTALMRWAIEETRVAGPLNATANEPVTNAEFTRAAAGQLHRPAIMPVPAFAIRALVGEMGEVLVVGGQRVIPKRALDLGFRFRYQDIRTALASVLG